MQILVRRSMALGDVVLITPIIEQLYLMHEGNAEIDVSTRYPEIFKNNPYVREATNSIPQKPYDLIYDLDNVYEANPKMHIIEAYSQKVFGNVTYNMQPKLYPTISDRHNIVGFLEDNNLVKTDFILLHMRNEPSWPSRHMGANWWESLCLLLEKFTQLQIVQVGRSPDHAFNISNKFINAVDMFTLQEFTALTDYAKLFVGVDSSLMHIASTTACPILGMFTSASHEYRKPLRKTGKFFAVRPQIDCYGCQHDEPPPITNYVCRRGDLECLKIMDPGNVLKAIQQVLPQCV